MPHSFGDYSLSLSLSLSLSSFDSARPLQSPSFSTTVDYRQKIGYQDVHEVLYHRQQRNIDTSIGQILGCLLFVQRSTVLFILDISGWMRQQTPRYEKNRTASVSRLSRTITTAGCRDSAPSKPHRDHPVDRSRITSCSRITRRQRTLVPS